MDKEKRRAAYYEKADFSNLMRSKKGRRLLAPVKRVTMNISERVYQEANELDGYFGMGYQNVLKTAMTLGLTELYQQLSAHQASAK